MRRVEVSRRLGSAEEVAGSLAAHRGLIGGNLDAQRPSPPDIGFSYQALFDHMDSELAIVASRLVLAEDRHVKQLARISQLRRRRDRGFADTYDKQVAARGILASLYGKEMDFELAAVSGRTPDSSKTLAEQVDQTVKCLRDRPGREEPSAKVAGVGVDFTAMADDLEAGRTELIAVRSELVAATKIADGTRQATRDVIEEFDLVFLWIARSLERLFLLAREEELAERVRSSARRVTRRQGEPGEEEAEPREPSSDGSVAEPDAAPSEMTEEGSRAADS